MIDKTRQECINCNLCKKNCYFLEKYDLNLKDFTYRQDLRYHCFLCNKYQNVCPKNLSGKEISKKMRNINPKGLKKEKEIRDPYIYKNDDFSPTSDLIYLGCSFPGYYPKTSKKLIEIARNLGSDFTIDCCKFTIDNLGEDLNLSNMDDYYNSKGIKRLVCACPNCFHYLKKKFKKTKVISVFAYLKENKIGEKINKKIEVFFPCSDRYNREIFNDIEYFLEDGYIDQYKDVNCCGLGGFAIVNEPDIKTYIKEKMKELQKDSIYTYYSSCSFQFKSYGLENIKNILSEILGVDEKVNLDYKDDLIKFKNFKRNS